MGFINSANHEMFALITDVGGGVVLYGGETWAVKEHYMIMLETNDAKDGYMNVQC